MKLFKTSLLALAAALTVAGCGGGGGANTTPRASISAVKVFGDSLADVGTFGYKFTVAVSATQQSMIYPDRIAAAYGVSSCNYFAGTSATTFVTNTAQTGCGNYAIGGGVINYPANDTSPAGTNPLDITQQLKVASSAFGANDLALIDGGGNDGAALIEAFLAASTPVAAGGDGGASFFGLVGTLLTPTQLQTAEVGAASGNATALITAGTQYMTALADKLYASVNTNVLGKGVTHVAILNMPAILQTPEFQGALAQITAAEGATAAAQLQTVFAGWLTTYNAELSADAGSDSRVAIVDFYDNFNQEIVTPAQFGLTNVKTPLCSGTTDFPKCLASTLSANPPAGVTDPNWWTTYAFANDFHPTPYGHQLVAQLISVTLSNKGWL